MRLLMDVCSPHTSPKFPIGLNNFLKSGLLFVLTFNNHFLSQVKEAQKSDQGLPATQTQPVRNNLYLKELNFYITADDPLGPVKDDLTDCDGIKISFSELEASSGVPTCDSEYKLKIKFKKFSATEYKPGTTTSPPTVLPDSVCSWCGSLGSKWLNFADIRFRYRPKRI